MILKVITSALVVVSLHALSIPNSVAETKLRYCGMYNNYNYGYSILIPNGLVGVTDPPPSPQHGIMIALTADLKGQISVNGDYNALLWPTTEAAVNDYLEWLKEASDKVTQSSRQKVTLNRLPAIRDVSYYIDKTTGETMVQDLVLALRDAKGEVGIVYTIKLKTRSIDYEKCKIIIDEIIRGFRTENLPGRIRATQT